MRSRSYGRDRELTIRMFGTMFLLGLVYLVFIGILVAYLGDIFIVLILVGILLVVQYFTSDKLVLRAVRAKEVSPEEMPQLHGIVERLAQVVDIPKPKVALADTDIPNAFVTGRNLRNSVVCVTSGLMKRLDDAELEAVLGHELAHIKNRDVTVMTLAAFFSTLAGMLAALLGRGMFYSAMFGGFGRSRQGGGGGIMMVIMVVTLVSIVTYFVSQLLILALTRYREYAADRGGAILVGAPATLASALTKISGTIARIPQDDLRRVEGASAFFIIPALHEGSMARFFSSHPPVEKRVERLRRMQQEMEQL